MNPAERQRAYYAATASRYEEMHLNESSGEPFLTNYLAAMLRMIDAKSLLDVGTATGRVLTELSGLLPGVFLCGLDPVPELLRQGSVGALVGGVGERLPFSDGSFDAVCEFGMLHHVPDPNAVVREMMRVARKAVFISDSNRFAQGSYAVRLAKLAIYKTGLWPAYQYIRTRGRGYLETPGDGISYSYSVFDSYDLIRPWATRVVLVPNTWRKDRTWLNPLLSSEGILLSALK